MKAAIWQGFDHYWENESHRLNRFGSYLECGSAGQNSDRCVFNSSMEIGRFPPDMCHTYALVRPVDLLTGGRVDGEVSAVVRGWLGERVEVDGNLITHMLPQGDFAATVIMRGFNVECTNFPHGFHTRGFGLLLTGIRQSEGDGSAGISFVPRYVMFPAKSPDPFTNPDRYVWRIIPFPKGVEPHTPDQFEYRMTLYYSVIFDRADRVAFTTQDTLRLEHYASRSASLRAATRVIQGESGTGYNHAAVGIRGFRWELLDWDRTRFDGRYLRRLECLIDGTSYDPGAGQMNVHAKMEFANARGRKGREHTVTRDSLFRTLRRFSNPREEVRTRSLRTSYSFHAEHELYPTLIQVRDGAAVYPVIRLYNFLRGATTASRGFRLPS